MVNNMYITINSYTQSNHKTTRRTPPSFKAIDAKLFEEFSKEIQRVYSVNDFSYVCKSIYKNPNNIIGEGNSKIVYKIDGVSDYVLAASKRSDYLTGSGNSFIPVPNTLQKYNFGQAIATNGHGLQILRKVEGQEHSLDNWHRFGLQGFAVNKKQAEQFCSKVSEISALPLISYEQFALKLKYLNEKSIRVDSLNPNNILYDEKSKSINVVDLIDNKKALTRLSQPLNGKRDMISMILDSVMHKKIIEALNHIEQNELSYLSKIIIDKCKMASENVNLHNDPLNTRKFLEIVIERLQNRNKKSYEFLMANYDEFVSMYKDIL